MKKFIAIIALIIVGLTAMAKAPKAFKIGEFKFKAADDVLDCNCAAYRLDYDSVFEALGCIYSTHSFEEWDLAYEVRDVLFKKIVDNPKRIGAVDAFIAPNCPWLIFISWPSKPVDKIESKEKKNEELIQRIENLFKD